MASEQAQMQRMATGLAKQTFVLPSLAEPPVGIERLARLVGATM
jgi:arsenite-transporting ATPase